MTQEDLGLQRLTLAELFPVGGPAVHVNQPVHAGDTPLHDHDFFEIAVVLAGTALHRTIHGLYPLRPGMVIVLQPGQWHAYEKAHSLELCNCCFGSDLLLRELAWVRSDPVLGALFPGVFSPAAASVRPTGSQGVSVHAVGADTLVDIRAHCQRLRQLTTATDSVRRRGDVIAHLLLLFGSLARAVKPSRQAIQPPHALHAAIQAVVDTIEGDLRREWALAELAARAGLQRSHFVRQFRRLTGQAPIAYIARRRAEMAAVLLLTTDLAIADIGRRVGWDDPNYFARRFRAAFGLSARTYRAQLPVPALTRPGEAWIQW